MLKHLLSLIFVVLLPLISPATVDSVDENQIRLVLHLLDYLGRDYGGAVAKGKVVSDFEYNEQKEFVSLLARTLPNLKINSDIRHALKNDVESLQKNINQKADASLIQKQTEKIRDDIIANVDLPQAPLQWPNLYLARKLFLQRCSQCHGENGDGKGKLAADLEPRPTNFLDKNVMAKSNPFSSYNTIKLGVTGTAMTPSTDLNPEQIWTLAFFVHSLRHQNNLDSKIKFEPQWFSPETLRLLAQSSDQEVSEKLFASSPDQEKKLALLRTVSFDGSFKGLLQLAKWRLKESESHFRKGDIDGARDQAIKAYLEGIEPVEPKIKATDADLIADIEGKMSNVRDLVSKNQPIETVQKGIEEALLTITKIEERIENTALTPTVAFLTAAAILLREGFEAVLIVVALLSVLKALGGLQASRWVHAGWLAAVVVGLILWWATGQLLDIGGSQRETFEALVSFSAVAVLIFVGFWLHSRTEIHRWKMFINQRVEEIMERKSLFGLFTISFLGVVRESLETVLFIRAIWFDTNAQSKLAVGFGVLSAFFLVLILAWALLRFSRYLPLRTLFIVTSMTVGILAVILTGKGIHSLQETGLISITVAPINWRVEFLGLFPSWECLMAQLFVAALVTGLWWYGNRP